MGRFRRWAGIAGMVAGVALLLGAWMPSPAQAAPGVTVSSIQAKFFANPTDSGSFTATPNTAVDFTLTVPVLNWNPPSDAQAGCTNTGVDENTRPFTDVVPGSCQTIPAVQNGISEGCDGNACAGYAGPDRRSFDAEFEGSFNVSEAGDVTFNIFSDDGWVLGIGASNGNQPTFVSDSEGNTPTQGATTPFRNYSVVGTNNDTHAPQREDLVVHFPAAGSYPFEADYSEAALGQLAFTVDAGGAPIAPGGGGGGTNQQATTTTSAPTTTNCGNPVLTANPNTVVAGQQDQVTALCLDPNQVATIGISNSSGGYDTIGTANVDPNGRFSALVTIPATAASGAHFLLASTSSRSATAAITVTNGAPPSVTTVPPKVEGVAFTGRNSGDLALLGVGLLFAGLVLVAGRKIAEIPLDF